MPDVSEVTKCKISQNQAAQFVNKIVRILIIFLSKADKNLIVCKNLWYSIREKERNLTLEDLSEQIIDLSIPESWQGLLSSSPSVGNLQFKLSTEQNSIQHFA